MAWKMLNGQYSLRETQTAGVARMREMEESITRGGANGHVPGMGKTLMCLALVASKWDAAAPQGAQKQLFALPPKLLAQYEAEIKRFTFFSHTRDFAVPDANIYLVSTNELLKPDHPLFGVDWCRVFIDESHELRNEKNKILRAALRLRARYRWVLSGTFLVNREEDLLSACLFLGFGIRNAGQLKAALRSGWIRDNLVISSTAEDKAELALPPIVDAVINVDLCEGEALAYKRLAFENRNKSSIDCINVLRQFAANCSAKTNAVKRLVVTTLKESTTDKILLFTNYVSTIKLYESWFSAHKIRAVTYSGQIPMTKRAEIVAKFTTSASHRVMIIGFKCGNAGINLQVANTVILNEPYWNEACNEQAIARAYRSGQKKQVTVHRTVVRDTIESNILALSRRKHAAISDLIQ